MRMGGASIAALSSGRLAVCGGGGLVELSSSPGHDPFVRLATGTADSRGDAEVYHGRASRGIRAAAACRPGSTGGWVKGAGVVAAGGAEAQSGSKRGTGSCDASLCILSVRAEGIKLARSGANCRVNSMYFFALSKKSCGWAQRVASGAGVEGVVLRCERICEGLVGICLNCDLRDYVMGMINGGSVGADRGLRAWALGESQWDSCCRQPVGVVSLSDSLKCKRHVEMQERWTRVCESLCEIGQEILGA